MSAATIARLRSVVCAERARMKTPPAIPTPIASHTRIAPSTLVNPYALPASQRWKVVSEK